MSESGQERVRFRCSGCFRKLSAPTHLRGRTGRCPKCGKMLRIPAPSEGKRSAERREEVSPGGAAREETGPAAEAKPASVPSAGEKQGPTPESAEAGASAPATQEAVPAETAAHPPASPTLVRASGGNRCAACGRDLVADAEGRYEVCPCGCVLVRRGRERA